MVVGYEIQTDDLQLVYDLVQFLAEVVVYVIVEVAVAEVVVPSVYLLPVDGRHLVVAQAEVHDASPAFVLELEKRPILAFLLLQYGCHRLHHHVHTMAHDHGHMTAPFRDQTVSCFHDHKDHVHHVLHIHCHSLHAHHLDDPVLAVYDEHRSRTICQMVACDLALVQALIMAQVMASCAKNHKISWNIY